MSHRITPPVLPSTAEIVPEKVMSRLLKSFGDLPGRRSMLQKQPALRRGHFSKTGVL